MLSRAAQHLVVDDQLYINMLLRLHQGGPKITAVDLHNVVFCSLCIVQVMIAWTNAWKEEQWSHARGFKDLTSSWKNEEFT